MESAANATMLDKMGPTEGWKRVGTNALIKGYPAGTHVIVPFPVKPGSEDCFWHHGIFLGEIEDVEMVIHMVPEDNITCVKLDDFAAANRDALCVVKHRDESPEALQECIKRAYEKKAAGVQYDKVTNNCDHFATYCKTGKYVARKAEIMFALPPPVRGAVLAPPKTELK